MMQTLKQISIYTMSLFYIIAGANHFISPEFYMKMMPDYLPMHELLNTVSGAGEILLGFGVIIPQFRRIACLGIILLLVAVFPANVFMLSQAISGVDMGAPIWGLWLRLPIQLLFGYWAWKVKDL